MDNLKTEIKKWRDGAYKGQRQWSFVHHMTTFGAAILSLSVVAISQAKDWTPPYLSRDALIAVVSLLAAILASLAAKGNFERKWQANRRTRSKLDLLLIDADDETADQKKIREKFKRIIWAHDISVLGDNENDSSKDTD